MLDYFRFQGLRKRTIGQNITELHSDDAITNIKFIENELFAVSMSEDLDFGEGLRSGGSPY